MRSADFLPPWIGGKKLITLWQVKEYFADRLVSISRSILDYLSACIDASSHPLNEHQRKRLVASLSSMDEELHFLGLEMTRISVNRVKSEIDTISGANLLKAGEDIEQRFYDEIATLWLLYLAPEKQQYFSKTTLFGEQFKSQFPTANLEVIEAGNCFALSRFTACVYHLTRAMEIALRVLFCSLGMPAHIWSSTKWIKILDRVKGKIDKNNKTLANDPAWKSERAFYESAYAFLAAVRVPIRNPTMHVETIYDESGAENVYSAVRAFMRHIATKLKEAP
jgi:hypothetical protein